MSLFSTPEEHAANPPGTWEVHKAGERSWHLRARTGAVLEYCASKREAERRRTDSSTARLYAQEARWYAGEPVTNWRPWADVKAEREKRAARFPVTA
jgi:hypothetical protein